MKKVIFLLLFIIVQASASTQDNESFELAKTIFFKSNASNINDHINSMTEMVITRQPEWDKYRGLIRDKVEVILTSESYQDKVAIIISKNFTHGDLLLLSEIMSRPVMVKWNKTAPQFWPEIAMATTDHILPLVGNLVKDIAEKERGISDYEESGDEAKKLISLIRNNKCNELQVYADELLKNNPNQINALYSKGYCHHKGLSYNQAEQLFLKVYKQNSKYRRINYNLARLYLDLGKHRQALGYATDETNLNPEDPDSFVLLALAQLKNKDKVKACDSFKEAALIDPRITNFPLKLEACGL
jgi:tetratricopeptide (TPR) repeat protein